MQIKSYPKVNIYLHIVGKKDGYHLINSRFVKVRNIFDMISFVKKDKPNNKFELLGEFGCETKNNTIYKAYVQLCKIDDKVEQFFKEYAVQVDKQIPYFAGLGGGSSNCASFILLVNQICNLKLPLQILLDIGSSIGADVPFFIYDVDSANVCGFGQNVKPFDDMKIDLEIWTPDIKCDTKEIFELFSKKYKDKTPQNLPDLQNLTSQNILNNYKREDLNHLYNPAIELYPKLTKIDFINKAFFSGSGSSFFWEKI